ncbi:MAG: cyclic nucleotide-binding domain-containing protein [Desulfobacterales bacterium]|jgi:CRP-like cAMP-binding protein
MIESLAFKAMLMGIISACSLPMGAVTSFFWKPGDKTVAFLMAGGGGALLAALTIDLVGEALNRGHYLALCCGCLAGGLLFIALDYLINNYGGFLRKASTTIYHLRKQEHRQYKKILSQITRTDIFRHLSTSDFKTLSYSIQSRDIKEGMLVYHPGDPPEALYIILEGAVEIIRFKNGEERSVQKLSRNDAFGRSAFISGTPHASAAVAVSDTMLLLLPRSVFNILLPNSTTLRQVVHLWLRGSELFDYLRDQHGMSEADIREWCDRATQNLIKRGSIPPAILPDHGAGEFVAIAQQTRRLPIFHGLPQEELETIASRLILKQHPKSDTLFFKGDISDRLYVIKQGQVSLIDPHEKHRKPTVVEDNDVFGGLACLTGARHTVSAITNKKTMMWVLRQSDLGDLLQKAPTFRERLKLFLKENTVSAYLEGRLHFDTDKITGWVTHALNTIDRGKPIPAARDLSQTIKEHGGAALAIWLGILLDGIPESLVIGSSMIHSQISLSLLVGLFLSNYPEALSSSIGMRQQGLSTARILVMWCSLVLITGVGAALGNIFFVEVPPFVFALVEGIAAGAMLTMIAQTMLPEAYFKGGSIIGFATLLGFLAAILSKLLESSH